MNIGKEYYLGNIMIEKNNNREYRKEEMSKNVLAIQVII